MLSKVKGYLMCNTCGCQYFTFDELIWYNYRCSQCGHVYKSTGQKSICPKCGSDNVKKKG